MRSYLRRKLSTAYGKRNSLRVLCLFVLPFVMGSRHLCFGETDGHTDRIIAGSGCDGINFEKDGYVVRSSRINDPFDFLPWVQVKQRRAEAAIAALVDSKPFLYSTARDDALTIIERENFLPDTIEVPVRIRVEILKVENCANRSLDLVYGVYSTQILPVLSSTPEARVIERQAPQTTAGIANGDVSSANLLRVTPTMGYDSTNKLAVGGRLEILPQRLKEFPFSSIAVEGQGSSTKRFITAAVSGSIDPWDWLASSDWNVNYSNDSRPTGAGNLNGGHLSAQFSGVSHPFANGNVIGRFGGLLEGGNRYNSLHNVRLAPNTLNSTGFGAFKLYGGISSRLKHNVFSVSYGLELGSAGPAARLDWHKHIGDIRHEFWYPLGDHRILDLESRFTIGGLQVPGKIPLSERFFGGNDEQFFIPGDSWRIRENPVIRAIPGSRFFRTRAGAGGEEFFSYNFTAAYVVWTSTHAS